MRCSIGSIGTCARSTPRRSARLRAAAVAGIDVPVAIAAGRTGWALTGGAGSGGAPAAGRLSRSAATMRPPGPVPRTVRRSMLRSSASRLVSGDATTRPVWATAGGGRSRCCGRWGSVSDSRCAGAAAARSRRRGGVLALVEEPTDAFATGEGLTDLADSVETTGRRCLDVGLRLVGLDPQERRAGGDRGAVVGEPLGDGAFLHRQAEFRHQEFSRHGRPFVGGTRRRAASAEATTSAASTSIIRGPDASIDTVIVASRLTGVVRSPS